MNNSLDVRDFEGAIFQFGQQINRFEETVAAFCRAVEKLQRIEGMKAENAVRADRGLAPAYDEEGFHTA